MSPPHSSSPSTKQEPFWLCCQAIFPSGLAHTPHVEVRVLQRSLWVLDGPAPWPPVSQAIGRHLQGAGRSSSWRLSGASPPSLIRAAADTRVRDQQAPGSSSRFSPACSGTQINTSAGPSCDATAPLSTADTQPLGWPCHLTQEGSASGQG